MDETQTGLATIEKKLKASKKQLTVGDAASIAAINMDDAKHALDQLLEKYESRLKVTENGDLIYDFGKSLQRRGKKSLKEVWGEIKEVSWKVFKFLFRIWITVMLVVYFVLFLLIMIGLVVVSITRNSDDNDGGSVGGGIGFFRMYLIWDLFTDLFMYRTISGRTTYRTDSRGYRYKEYEPIGRKSKSGKTKKGFVAAVYDFVFGPARVTSSPLENFKEVAAYLRENKALMVQSETIGLAGWKKQEAEDFFAECLVKFNGKAEITDEGILYGTFNELVRGKSNLPTAQQIEWYWEEYEAPYRQSGNSATRNMIIAGMNGVNLFFSFKVMQGWLYELIPTMPLDTVALTTILLGYVPFVFSLIFFLIPLIRFFQNKTRNEKIHVNNIRKRLMKVIFQAKGGIVEEEKLMEIVNSAEKGEEKLNPDQIKAIMEDLVFDLEGELRVNDNGELAYYFESLEKEMKEIQKIRATSRDNNDLGDIVFDSGSQS
ncbi:MAG: hypothetical protein AAGI07_09705 [Bacteroidota bacterium]